jgi:hypothetical protein
LYEKLESAKNNNDNQFGLHRLVACLYQNTLNHEIHHIDKNNQRNDTCNLVKVKRDKHVWIDKLPISEGKRISIGMQAEQKRIIFKSPRQTLAQNENLILEILKKETK